MDFSFKKKVQTKTADLFFTTSSFTSLYQIYQTCSIYYPCNISRLKIAWKWIGQWSLDAVKGQIQRLIQQDVIKQTFEDNNNDGARENIKHWGIVNMLLHK